MCQMSLLNITEQMEKLRPETGSDPLGSETGGQGPPSWACQPQGSCLQGPPEPQEARLNHDFGPEDWMGSCLQARERLWAFPGQVVS